MKEKMSKSDVVILGMHRSGTSLLAGTLARCGWWVSDSDDQMLAQEDNPMGFWERLDVVDINDEILAQHAQSWHTVFAESALLEAEAANPLADRISDIGEQLAEHAPFVLKDPRLCLTWRYWAGQLSGARVIAITRNPMEVARSLKVRNGLPIALGLGIWFRYIRAIADIAKRQKVYSVEHRALIEDSRQVTRQILAYLIPGATEAEISSQMEAESIVDRNLVHHYGEESSLRIGYPEVAVVWEKVKAGDYTNLPDTLEFIQEPVYQELYAHWAHADTLLARVHELEEREIVYQEQADQLVQKDALLQHREAEQRDLEAQYAANQHCIAESLVAYRSSSLYRGSRFLKKLVTLFTRGNDPDALDKITEILAEQNYLEIRESSSGPFAEMMELAIKNPLQFIRQINLSRIKTAYRMLSNPEERANFSIALTRYQSNVVGKKLVLFEPGSVAAEHIQLEHQENPETSIIIPVFNELDSTLACIKSVAESAKEMSFEIIIADDCSSDATQQLAEQIENLGVVRTEQNEGFLGNCNHAARQARGDYLVFLNNDTNVQPAWLEELIAPMKTFPEVGLTGSKLVYPDGRLQEAGGIVFSDAAGWNYGRLGDRHAPEYNYVREVDYVSGASIALRRSTWEQLGGFDERYRPAYYEDTDLCFQIRESGSKVIYTPFSEVVHYEGVSHGTDENEGVKKHQVVNKEKFYYKWKSQLEQQHYKDAASLFLAKVSGRQPVVLIIDHYVPMHDRDAGSRSTRKYVELLVQDGLRVIFMGDNFYPHQPYTEELQRLGVEVLYGEYYKNNWEKWLKESLGFIDSVYIHRPHIAEKYLDRIKELSPDTRVVYFGHDLHFLRVQREADVSGGDELTQLAEQWQEKEIRIMRAADLSLFPAEYEAEKVRELDSKIHVDHIPLYWFDESEISPPLRPVYGQNILFVGGFGHPPNCDGLIWFYESIWPIILERNPETRLTIVGSKCPQSVKQLQNANIQVLGEVSDAVLEDAYRNTRLAIVPLRYGAGIKGKVLEAMSKGVPVCTTPVGMEGLPEDSREYLLSSDSEKGFAENVLKLLEDKAKANQIRANALDILKLHFSRNAARSLIRHLLAQGH